LRADQQLQQGPQGRMPRSEDRGIRLAHSDNVDLTDPATLLT
jgi:hypothetical protein